MSKREPFKIRSFAALHNAVLFSLSVYMCVESLRQAYDNFGWAQKFQLWCNQMEPPPKFTPSGYKLARVLWIHYISKAYEFMDTIIMVLKKNTKQITFLHVYHHATTFFPVWWSVVKYGPGGEPYFCCALNSFIHILMYGYYFASSLGLKARSFKPMVTYGQMVQFLCLIIEALYLLVTNCYTPRLCAVFLLFQCIVFFALFTDFARKTYWMPEKKHKSA